MSAHEYPGKSAYRGTVASRYDEDRVIESVWALEQEFVATWARTLRPGRKLLDVPAGTGRFLKLFCQQGLEVTALDVSPDMVAEIYRRHPGIASTIKAGVGDAEHLALPDDAVDYVISWRFFHLIPGPVADRVLGEFHRVCRDTVLVQVFAVQPPFWRQLLAGLRRRLLPPPASPSPKGSEGSDSCPWAHIKSFSHSEADLRARFKKAGFWVERAVTLDWQHGRPNRAYFLKRAGAGAGRA